ncbi:hypothetical protein [Cellulomonas sp. PhB143]|uniref:hypothetical protein n=1 Tax=Cellulomonas sp. PhB143 TaxID=2485186 RepID=UPI000F468967|nr:hypothetical protein [Cellulomonas sp. PhB143]ROS75309.1 hypothetical protein EDF32_1717 [Cellulomonas sp. PhB143]
MLTIVADAFDGGALLVARAARRRGTPVTLSTPAQLVRRGWAHRVDAHGRPRPEGRGHGLLWVRVAAVSPAPFAAAAAADRDYATAEATALVVSWLYGQGSSVVNRPTGADLTGPGWDRPAWVRAAARVGLPVVPARLGAPSPLPAGSVLELVVDGRAAPGACGARQDLAPGVARLAEAAGCRLLGVVWSGGAVADATPCPPVDAVGAEAFARWCAAEAGSERRWSA